MNSKSGDLSIGEDCKELLHFMGRYSDWTDDTNLYLKSSKLLIKVADASPMLVFSFPKDVDKKFHSNSYESYRGIWNKELINNKYSVKELGQALNWGCLENKKNEERFHCKEFGGKIYYILFPGDIDNQTYVAIFSVEKDKVLSESFIVFFSNFFKNSFQQIKKWNNLETEKELIYNDDITGLFNQRKMLADLDYAIDRYNKLKEEFTVFFIDIDHFKNVNDGYGHLVGTKLLQSVGKLLKQVLRESDYIYRYGGDEFVMIVPDVTEKVAKKIANRILNSVKGNIFTIDGCKDFKLAVSIGVSIFPRDASDREQILAIADKMMYHAKSKGRGMVCMASELFG